MPVMITSSEGFRGAGLALSRAAVFVFLADAFTRLARVGFRGAPAVAPFIFHSDRLGFELLNCRVKRAEQIGSFSLSYQLVMMIGHRNFSPIHQLVCGKRP